MEVLDSKPAVGSIATTASSAGAYSYGTSFVDLTSLATTTASTTSWFADDDLAASDDEDYYSMMHTMGTQPIQVRKPRKPRAPRTHKVDFVPPTFLHNNDKEPVSADHGAMSDVVVKQEPVDSSVEQPTVASSSSSSAALHSSPQRGAKRKREVDEGSAANNRVAIMASAVDEQLPVVAAVPALAAKQQTARLPKGPRASKSSASRAQGKLAARTAQASPPPPPTPRFAHPTLAAAAASYPVSIPRDLEEREEYNGSGGEDVGDAASPPAPSTSDIVPWARPMMVNESALGATLRVVTKDSGSDSAAKCSQIEKLRSTQITFTRHDRQPTQPKRKVDPTLKYFPLKQCDCRQCLDYDPNRARRKVHKKNAADGAATSEAIDIRDIDFYCKECFYTSTHNTFYTTSPTLQFNCEQCRKRVSPSELPW
jgi:hypothetical protein